MGHPARPLVVPTPRDTLEAYFEAEAASDQRHEYLRGRIVALAGAAPEHNVIKDNVSEALRRTFRPRGCVVTTSDQRVQVTEDAYVYPDVVVACDPRYRRTPRPASLVNPDLVVEVLSETTSQRDRDAKLEAYTRMPSVQEYWIVASDRPFVTQFVRRADGDAERWTAVLVRGLDATVRSARLDCAVAMADVYALVSFDDDPASSDDVASDDAAA
jgi:Uma2 family endonuclease